MYRFARNEEIDLDELRAQLRKMSDEDAALREGGSVHVPRQITPAGVRDSVGGS